MAINSVWVFESCSIDVDVFISIATLRCDSMSIEFLRFNYQRIISKSTSRNVPSLTISNQSVHSSFCKF